MVRNTSSSSYDQVKVHGRGLYNYFLNELVVGGASITIECIRRTLMKLEEEGELRAKVSERVVLAPICFFLI